MKKYDPSADVSDDQNAYGYTTAHALIHLLEACGNDLSRENVLKQATNIHDYRPPLALPGLVVSTNPDDYAPIKQMQMVKFDGSIWKLLEIDLRRAQQLTSGATKRMTDAIRSATSSPMT